MKILVAALVALAFVAVAALVPAMGHDMNHPDLDGWYETLDRPDGQWCCDRTDCKPTEYRLGADGYEVLIDERFPGVTAASWQKVPPANVVPTENPTGSAVACWWGGEVRCFVPQALF